MGIAFVLFLPATILGQVFGEQRIISSAINDPEGLHYEDLDGDGAIDVLIGSSYSGSLVWFRNLGPGVYSNSISIDRLPGAILHITTADLNTDGHLDVVVSGGNFGFSLSYYPNDGLGNFGGPVPINGTSDGFFDVHCADIDGDDDLDVVASARWGNYLAWFENDGTGTFIETYNLEVIEFPMGLVVDDMDGDEDIDIIVAVAASVNQNAHILQFTNEGDGLFGAGALLDEPDGGSGHIISVDFDGDGDLDILASASGNDDLIGWLENLGGGSFSSVIPINQTLNYPSSLQVVDLDGDGHQDVLATNLSWVDEKMCWWPNLGGGNFEGYTTIEDDVYQPECAIGADFDSDGDIDIVSGVGCCDLTYFENLGAGDFAEGILITENVNQANSLFVADIDDDGDLDVASSSSGDNKIAWYPNTQGEGCLDPVATNYDPDAWIDNGSCCLMPSSCSGDTNCDGLVDSLDVLSVLGSFDCVGFDCPLDMDGDGVVGVSDFMLVLGGFGMECE